MHDLIGDLEAEVLNRIGDERDRRLGRPEGIERGIVLRVEHLKSEDWPEKGVYQRGPYVTKLTVDGEHGQREVVFPGYIDKVVRGQFKIEDYPMRVEYYPIDTEVGRQWVPDILILLPSWSWDQGYRVEGARRDIWNL